MFCISLESYGKLWLPTVKSLEGHGTLPDNHPSITSHIVSKETTGITISLSKFVAHGNLKWKFILRATFWVFKMCDLESDFERFLHDSRQFVSWNSCAHDETGTHETPYPVVHSLQNDSIRQSWDWNHETVKLVENKW